MPDLKSPAALLTLHLLTFNANPVSPCYQVNPRPLTAEELQTCLHLSREAEAIMGNKAGIRQAETFYRQRTNNK